MSRTGGLPSGTVTFLFTDIEGSTRLLQQLGAERYAEELIRHRELIREAVQSQAGFEFGTEGDAFFTVFARAADSLVAAESMQAALGDGPIRVRVGIHSGEPLVADDDYVGLDVHKAARICSAAHGGQVLVSQRTRELAGASLLDLGEHRLKDLTAPERLFQLGSAQFPPPRTLRQTNLPVQPTPLLGRQEELAELLGLSRSSRLVTLTGPGGTGKTRLALELAAELADAYADGVWWVPLAAVSNAELVLPTIAQAVGARDDLGEHLADRRMALLLDNLEQVLDAAPLIADLLARAPRLHVIATSRERLALAAEQEYPVPPLGEAAAVELFMTRARQVRPGFESDGAVEEICRRLDRLPLALELAATRVKLMPPAQILARLESRLGLLSGGSRDLPPRQATMRAAIAWSYDLLSKAERRVFRALGVFAGSFELEAAEEVGHSRLDELQSLVDKSLLRQLADGRFFLLETTREYALEQLADASEPEEVRRRHAEWFLQLAAGAQAGLRSEQQRVWLERLRADNDNLRTALAWTLEHDLARGLELAGTLYRPWHMRGQLPELIGWYERALEHRAAIDAPALARGLRIYGTALMFCEHYERAERVLSDSLELWRRIGDPLGEAEVLNQLGSVASSTGAPKRALHLQQEALEIFRRAQDRAGIARSLHLVGEDLRDLGDLDRATAMLDEAAAIDIELGDRDAAMTSLHSLGDLALDGGDPRQAERRYREALAICFELDDERSQAYCLAGLACVAALDGDMASAGRRWGLAEAVERRLGLRMLAGERGRYERNLAAHASEAAFCAGYEGAEALPLEPAVRDLLGLRESDEFHHDKPFA